MTQTLPWFLLSAALLVSPVMAEAAPAAGALDNWPWRLRDSSLPEFVCQCVHSKAESDAKIAAAFQQLFHGDAATQAIYYPAGSNAAGPLAYVTDVANHDVRTEGMSYGMMIAVQLNHKAEFDALWNWARTYMYIGSPTHPSQGYFSWSARRRRTERGDGCARRRRVFCDVALFLPPTRWGNGMGIYNYKARRTSF